MSILYIYIYIYKRVTRISSEKPRLPLISNQKKKRKKNMKDFTKIINQKLEPEQYLINVYTTFTIAISLIAIGRYVGVIYGGLLTISLCGLIMMHIYLMRIYLIAIRVDTSFIIQALLVTVIVFTCFSLGILVTPPGECSCLGGILSSILFSLVCLSTINIFWSSQLFFKMNIYIGLFVMCGFILCDTQKIIEKVRMGDKDYIMHAVTLLIDFITIFKYLLLILVNESKSNKKSKNKI